MTPQKERRFTMAKKRGAVFCVEVNRAQTPSSGSQISADLRAPPFTRLVE